MRGHLRHQQDIRKKVSSSQFHIEEPLWKISVEGDGMKEPTKGYIGVYLRKKEHWLAVG